MAMALCVPGTRVYDVTSKADAFINESVKAHFTDDEKMTKGIGFPVCCSLNGLVGHVSPFTEHTVQIAENDLVKIDLGVHIDGYLAVVAHTFFAQTEAKDVTGPAANAVLAADKAARVAAKLLTAGATNTVITAAIAAIAADYKVTPVLGVLSHNIERNLIDGEKTILNKEDAEHKGKECTFAAGEVYALDIVMSTGEGRPRRSEERTTVYKKSNLRPSLKVNSARLLKNEVDHSFPHFPFALTACNPKFARLGVLECERTGALEPFPVLSEKKGFVVAQTKFLVGVMPDGKPSVLTGLPVADVVKSEHSVSNQEYAALLE